MSDFDDAYRQAPAMFGGEPDALLVRHVDRLPLDHLVLDVGAGQGRHCLYLARRGLRVLAVDPSRVGLDAIERRARDQALAIETCCGRVEDLTPPPAGFGAILLFGLIPILTLDALARLGASLPEWLAPGGVLLATAFTTDDPGHEPKRRTWQHLGEASYRGPAGQTFTYLRPGELPLRFPGLTVLEHAEHLGPPHRHGDGPVERHALAEVALVRASARPEIPTPG